MQPSYDDLLKTNQELLKINAELQKTIAILTERISKLEEQLKINSKNSSKPPASDQKPNSDDPPRKGGAIRGHKGLSRTLIENPTSVHEHKPTSCPGCGSAKIKLSAPWIFQQTEIPQLKPIVTEYRCYGCDCEICGEKQVAALPEGVEYGAFGPNLAARIALFTTKFRLSKRQAQALIKLDHGIDISVGSISNIEGRMAVALEKPYEEIRQEVSRKDTTKHIDETGMRESAQNRFLWVVSTATAVCFSIQKGRAKIHLNNILPLKDSGAVVTDRYRVYDFQNHQWCWAHLVRNIRRFSEREGVDRRIATALLFEAKDMLRSYALYRKSKEDRQGAYRAIYYRRKRIESLLWDAFFDGSESFSSFAETCLDHLKKLWLFAKLRGVEPTNNQAERDLRTMVIWRKTSFGTRSDRGTRFIERAMSVIATLERGARKVVGFFEAIYRSRFDSRVVVPHPVHP